MTISLTNPFVPYILLFLRSISTRLESAFRRLIRPHPDSLVRGALADLAYSKADLIVENALLRQWHIPRAIWGTTRDSQPSGETTDPKSA